MEHQKAGSDGATQADPRLSFTDALNRAAGYIGSYVREVRTDGTDGVQGKITAVCVRDEHSTGAVEITCELTHHDGEGNTLTRWVHLHSLVAA